MSEVENQMPHPGGVRTPEGKAVSRYNAQKHAILRETITEYEKVDAEQFYNDLAEDLAPHGRLQELLVENIASNAIRLQRIAKAEGEMVKDSITPEPYDVNLKSYSPEFSPSKADKLLVYSRYQTATENRIFRALIVYKQIKQYEQIG